MKSEEVVEESPHKRLKTDDPLNLKIVNQLEYYFSDINIYKDKFMLEEIAKDNGWITIEKLLTFSRLKSLTTDEAAIALAMKNVKSENIVIDHTLKKIKRIRELPSSKFAEDVEKRTLHLSGFPQDYTYENLMRWCSQYGPTESIQMRHYFKTKAFKGNILVVYRDEKDVQNIITNLPLKCRDREIRLETMDAYKKRKSEMAKKRNLRKSKSGGK